MKHTISKHYAGGGYNSPIKQVTKQTKLKDVPEQLVNSGKKIVNSAVDYSRQVGNRIGNTTVGEALNVARNVARVASNIPPGILFTDEKKLSATKTKLKPRMLKQELTRLKK